MPSSSAVYLKMNIGKIQPIELTNKTAYLAGVIVGDGYISNSVKSRTDKAKDYRVSIDISDIEYLTYLHKLILSVIDTKSKPKYSVIKGYRKKRMYFQFRNKSFFYFLTKTLQIPNGKKSSIVKVPNPIKESTGAIKRHFIAGLFDTDGGFRRGTLGFTSSSQALLDDVAVLLKELSINCLKEEWNNKKYKRNYFGLIIPRNQIDTFLNKFPIQNIEKLTRIHKKFHAEVPEWPNGMVSFY